MAKINADSRAERAKLTAADAVISGHNTCAAEHFVSICRFLSDAMAQLFLLCSILLLSGLDIRFPPAGH
jgi:hypothetical protein